MGLRDWLFDRGENTKNKNATSLPNLRDKQVQLLYESVAHREARREAIEEYSSMVLDALNERMDERFNEGNIDISFSRYGMSPFSIRDTAQELEISFGAGFEAGGEFHAFNNVTNKQSEFEDVLRLYIAALLKNKGYTVSLINYDRTIHVSWDDDAFTNALHSFYFESQVDAFRDGVPLEDILA